MTDTSKTVGWREIIADVYKRLEAGTLIPATTYLSPAFGEPDLWEQVKGDRSEYYKTLACQSHTCEACAIGSLFVGAFSITDPNPGRRDRTGREGMINALEPYFERENLVLMESFFEGWVHNGHEENVREWARTYPTKRQRLVAILKNIEANNGEFKP
jgi:hypothetical protein